ncbi:hypothetical protein E2C01_079697 [Portunus trituberculatus]|uniref:Uncharacterized protein n=1 Tax=Portunus trituberculatus TaxID=210409 RepID=A0A5B7IXP5_PORTR|nr:hypothetical protein [Portunus trituberculatus]
MFSGSGCSCEMVLTPRPSAPSHPRHLQQTTSRSVALAWSAVRRSSCDKCQVCVALTRPDTTTCLGGG